MKKYELAVFIGRFQILHHGHMDVIKSAFNVAHNVLILVGSADCPSDSRNPFSFDERRKFIMDSVSAEFGDRVMNYNFSVNPLHDHHYSNEEWASEVQEAVSNISTLDNKVVLIGHHKDESSFYLDMFPQWEQLEVPNYMSLNSTDLRAVYYEKNIELSTLPISSHMEEFLRKFQKSSQYTTLVDEHEFLKKYKEPYKNLPYAPIFVTVDAVVLCCGHVLMVKRGAHPGKGLWAMAGGFLNPKERIETAIVRELKEETRIAIPEHRLKESMRNVRVFDNPGRSLRGRTITHTGLFVLHETKLPRVRGSDDAEKAKWIPISKFREMRGQVYEDHWSIIEAMIGSK